MFLFKKSFSLSEPEQKELQKFVSKTIESMLATKEETLNIHKKFDTALVCSLEGNYLVFDIYQFSKFALYDKKNARRHNVPFYTAARSLNKNEETIIYTDDHKQKGLGIKNVQAFYYICDLLETVDINVFSAEKYKCFW